MALINQMDGIRDGWIIITVDRSIKNEVMKEGLSERKKWLNSGFN